MIFRTSDKPVPVRVARSVGGHLGQTAIIYNLQSRPPQQGRRLEAHWRVQIGDGRLICRWRRTSFASSKGMGSDDSEPVIELLPSTGSFSFCTAAALCSGQDLKLSAL